MVISGLWLALDKESIADGGDGIGVVGKLGNDLKLSGAEVVDCELQAAWDSVRGGVVAASDLRVFGLASRSSRECIVSRCVSKDLLTE